MNASISWGEMSNCDDHRAQPAPTPQSNTQIVTVRAAAADAVSAREAAYEADLLQRFRRRLRLLANLVATLLPLYALLHAFLSPTTRQSVAIGHLLLLLLCLLVRIIAPRLPTLHATRSVALASYALFSLGTAVIAAQLTHAQAQTPFPNQFVAYSSFSHIILSSLILPLAVWESALIAGIAISAMAWSSFALDWAEIVNGAQPLSASHFFILLTTSLIVFYLTYLNSMQRRQVFDATYQLQQNTQHLETLTTLDTVTGGWNRRHLERVLHTEMARSARFGHVFTLLAFDLDNFKAVNDTHGHDVGDEVLRAIERAARIALRETDTVARFGGDEFAIVLPETGIADALPFARRLQQTVKSELAPLSVAHPQIAHVTLSIGVFSCRERCIYTPRELLERADAKLYQAKSEGKNRIAI